MTIATATTAVAAITGNPFLAALNPPLNMVANELIQRLISDRQRQRVVSVVDHAAKAMLELRDQGAQLRSDDFFQDRDGRWTATEAVEAVLITASNTPQELKLPHLGHMLAFIALADLLNPSSAAWVLKQAEELSWTQYVLLAAVQNPDIELPDRQMVSVGGDRRTWDSLFIAEQLADLGYSYRYLIDGGQKETSLAGTKYPNMSAADQKLTNSGTMLSIALDLATVRPDVQRALVDLLRDALPTSRDE